MTRVLIVEDSRMTREAVEGQLVRSRNYLIYASIANAANAEIACMRDNVDLVLMDVCTEDGESGLKAAAKIKRNSPGIRIIIMTSMPEHSFLEKARRAGCDGFWYKEYGDMDLLSLCDRVMAGERVFPEETPALRIGCADSREFTQRELDIIRQLAQGRRYEDIADSLGITLNTVKYHVKNLMQKTGYQNTMQLVAEVVEKRLVLPRY